MKLNSDEGGANLEAGHEHAPSARIVAPNTVTSEIFRLQ
jgi:hypothetical protein